MESLRRHLLIASPHLSDPNFARTVVLLVQHSDEGTLGLVLNRPSDKRIKDVWSEVSDTPCDSEHLIHVGGPVPGPLMALHTDESLSDAQVMPGLYFTVESSKLDQLVRQEEQPFKLFVGHAGWSGGQLEGELEAGGWLTHAAALEHIFGDDAALWGKLAQQVGDSIVLSSLKVKHVPDDPRMN